MADSSRIRAPFIAACAARSPSVTSFNLSRAFTSLRTSTFTTQAAVVGRRAAAIDFAACTSPRFFAAAASSVRSAVKLSGATA
jgi:hypothetical protein